MFYTQIDHPHKTVTSGFAKFLWSWLHQLIPCWNTFSGTWEEAEGHHSIWRTGSKKKSLRQAHMNNKIQIDWQWTLQHARGIYASKHAFVQYMCGIRCSFIRMLLHYKGKILWVCRRLFSCLSRSFLWIGSCHRPSEDYPESYICISFLYQSRQKHNVMS